MTNELTSIFHDNRDNKICNWQTFEYKIGQRSASPVGHEFLKNLKTTLSENDVRLATVIDDTLFKDSMSPNDIQRIELNQQVEGTGKV